MAKKNKKAVVVDAVVTESPAPTPTVEQPVVNNGIRFDIPAPKRGKVRSRIMELVEAGPGACKDFKVENAKSFQIGVISAGRVKGLKFATQILGDKATVRVWYNGQREATPALVAA